MGAGVTQREKVTPNSLEWPHECDPVMRMMVISGGQPHLVTKNKIDRGPSGVRIYEPSPWLDKAPSKMRLTWVNFYYSRTRAFKTEIKANRGIHLYLLHVGMCTLCTLFTHTCVHCMCKHGIHLCLLHICMCTLCTLLTHTYVHCMCKRGIHLYLLHICMCTLRTELNTGLVQSNFKCGTEWMELSAFSNWWPCVAQLLLHGLAGGIQMCLLRRPFSFDYEEQAKTVRQSRCVVLGRRQRKKREREAADEKTDLSCGKSSFQSDVMFPSSHWFSPDPMLDRRSSSRQKEWFPKPFIEKET